MANFRFVVIGTLDGPVNPPRPLDDDGQRMAVQSLLDEQFRKPPQHERLTRMLREEFGA